MVADELLNEIPLPGNQTTQILVKFKVRCSTKWAAIKEKTISMDGNIHQNLVYQGRTQWVWRILCPLISSTTKMTLTCSLPHNLRCVFCFSVSALGSYHHYSTICIQAQKKFMMFICGLRVVFSREIQLFSFTKKLVNILFVHIVLISITNHLYTISKIKSCFKRNILTFTCETESLFLLFLSKTQEAHYYYCKSP